VYRGNTPETCSGFAVATSQQFVTSFDIFVSSFLWF
jgi:hypothetical protein